MKEVMLPFQRTIWTPYTLACTTNRLQEAPTIICSKQLMLIRHPLSVSATFEPRRLWASALTYSDRWAIVDGASPSTEVRSVTMKLARITTIRLWSLKIIKQVTLPRILLGTATRTIQQT